jgi:hypothetical protein
MFTLIGWTESQDSAALVNVAALADPHVRVSGDDIIVPGEQPGQAALTQLIGAYALGPNTTRAQLVSPSLRRVLNIELGPIDVGAEPAVPTPFIDLRMSPIVLDAEEALNAQAAEDAAGAARSTVLAWLADKPIEITRGDIRSVRVTNTTTLVANAWTNGALTFDQTLPAGRYQIVGGRFVSAGLQAWRCLFVGYQWRPGAIGYDVVSDVDHVAFRMGGLGIWGEFNHNTPPTIDFLSNSADTSQAGILDLIKIS